MYSKPVLCLLALCITVAAETINYTHNEYVGKGTPYSQADLNGDGILDVVSVPVGLANNKTGFYAILSNPDGSYQSPVFYASPYDQTTSSVALGDFNRDGKVDVAEVEGTKSYHIFLNHGDGTFASPWNFSISPNVADNVATSDFNRDGKLDLVILDEMQSPLLFLYGGGDGTFSAPFKIANGVPTTKLFVGDYDADGNADLATSWAHCDHGAGCTTYIGLLYGNGKGGFTAPTTLTLNVYYEVSSSDDVNSDGHSDLYGAYDGVIRMLYGSSNRLLVQRDVTPSNFAHSPAVVDLSGDAIKDLAVIESPTGEPTVSVMVGTKDGNYAPEQYLYSNDQLVPLLAGRYDRNTKPDLIAWRPFNSNEGDLEVLYNTSRGRFPPCAPPNAARGIQVCAPKDGSTVSSPVRFEVGADFTSPLRKTEVWIDGVKRKESFNSYATYSFLSGSFSLSSGAHRAVIYTAGYDNLLQKTTVNFTVR